MNGPAAKKDYNTIAKINGFDNKLAIPWGDDYEKMVSGMLYDDMAPELLRARMKGRHLCYQHNTYWPSTEEGYDNLISDREKILKKIFGNVGREPFIEPGLQVDYGINVSIGDQFYSNFNLVLLDCALITIGDRVLIGPNVSLLAATHEIEVETRRHTMGYSQPITIGDDCWIGANVTVLQGVTIGKGCTIAAGTVVTKDAPDFSVVKGIPGKVVKSVQPVD